jgi:hypothetical protein
LTQSLQNSVRLMPRSKAKLRIDPPYDRQLQGILAFASFSDAETTLRRLEKLRHEYSSTGDKKGVEHCRRIALQGRRRAELIGRNKKVRLQKRLHKLEIAAWFRVWLETPELFEDWLALRKGTTEYQRLQQSESLRFPE